MRRHDFKKLKVWQLSKELAVELYKLSHGFPKEEIFGLTNQLRKSAISIPSNISEGCGRGTELQLSHFFKHCSRISF
jgi:four helix bundle protein